MDHAQVKTTELETTKPERKRRAGVFPTVAALTGIGIAALTGCGPSAEATQEPKPTASTSAEATPSATPEVREPKEYTDEELLALQSEALPENLKQYEDMSVLDFEKVSIEDRLSYCSYLNRDIDYLQTEFYKAYDNDARYLLPDTFDKDSSAQDIIGANGIYTTAALVTHFGGMMYDRDTSQKILACGLENPSSENPTPGYKHWTELLDTYDYFGTPTVIAESGGLNTPDVISEKPSSTITTESGKEYFARTITYKTNEGGENDITTILVDYIDYKGEPKSTYVAYE